uniref:Uncharacterized protein n=1 Tax=Malurus cyaneus samueli TaxID=2593467 RepID=A0A8C5U1K5_9PASS
MTGRKTNVVKWRPGSLFILLDAMSPTHLSRSGNVSGVGETWLLAPQLIHSKTNQEMTVSALFLEAAENRTSFSWKHQMARRKAAPLQRLSFPRHCWQSLRKDHLTSW